MPQRYLSSEIHPFVRNLLYGTGIFSVNSRRPPPSYTVVALLFLEWRSATSIFWDRRPTSIFLQSRVPADRFKASPERDDRWEKIKDVFRVYGK